MSSTVSIPSPDVVGLATASGLTVSASSVILGRATSGSGAIEELSAGTSLAVSSGLLNTTQDIRTTATPQFSKLALGIGTFLSNERLHIVGADGAVTAPSLGPKDWLYIENNANANFSIAVGTGFTAEYKFFSAGATGPFASLKADSGAGSIAFTISGVAQFTVASTGVIITANTTDASSTTAGALVVAGGGAFAKSGWFGGPVVHKNYTVAALPAAASFGYGIAFVTDATLTAITGLGLTPTGGGTNIVPVYSDGTNWRII